MIELELTIQEDVIAEELSTWLKQFEATHRVHVNVTTFNWVSAWQELVKVALYRHGPDVSQIGSTWVSSLAGMNAIMPFSSSDIRLLGGAELFLPELWRNGIVEGGPEVWAIPWRAYLRLFYYRRDWLSQAGIDEKTAFSSPENFALALQRLADQGRHIPWSVPTVLSLDTVHNIGSWIWANGGDFVSPDGKHALFNQAEAMAGMSAYFDLHRYLNPQHRKQSENESFYQTGETALMIGGPETGLQDLNVGVSSFDEVRKNTGLAIPFGVPFIGASHLVVWRHTRYPSQARELVKFLIGQELQNKFIPTTGLMPVRLDVLHNPPFSTDPSFQIMVEGLKAGRSFPAVRLWGLVEDKLTMAFSEVWNDILESPQPDIPAILARRIESLANRLEMTLSQ